MSLVRLRRLQADFLKLQEYVRAHPRVQLVQYDGDPPERYQLRYQVRSLRQKDDELIEVSDHLVEIMLPRNYPRLPPQCRMLTPVFHPNIAPHAICIGDHWSAGEPLSSLVGRIGEMLAYQSYNTKSPLNGEAARWTDENIDRLPLDKVQMDVEERAAVPPPRPIPTALPVERPAPPPPVTKPVSPTEATVVSCPGCGARLRVFGDVTGKQFRCGRCQTVFSPPAGTATS
jgi:ubiquitin-protein ligase